MLKLSLSSILLFVSFASQALGAETKSLQANHTPGVQHAPPAPKELAAHHERAGRKGEAAALYEEMARTNAAARKVLSHRLVAIYTETGQTDKALRWAQEVMHENPDPQAYLAGVYSRLGQWKRAREILEREIAPNTNTTRAVTLRWQLAEVFEKQGDPVQARKALAEAVEAAKGTIMEESAHKRLDALKPPKDVRGRQGEGI